jgi:hypothetical protein
MTPVNVLDITQNQNATSTIVISNPNVGATAAAQVFLGNLSAGTAIIQTGTGYTAGGLIKQNATYIQSSGAGGITLNTAVSAPMVFGIGGVEAAQFTTGGAGANFKLSTYGAGTLVTDGSGNVTAASTATLKATINLKTFLNASAGNPTASSGSSVAHGLGQTPTNCMVGIRCTTTDAGYAVGTIIILSDGVSNSNNVGMSVWMNSTNIGWNVGSGGLNVINTSFTGVAITAANWQIYISASTN